MSQESNHEFKSNEYDGPNQTWICGGVANGLPCPLGPSHRGECRAACTPTRDGDRYYCNNASEFSGACDEGPLPDGSCCQMPPQCVPSKQAGKWVCNRGKCQTGPLPDGTCSMTFTVCKPVRSVLAKRGKATLAVFGLAIGSILILAGSSYRQAAISPGKLTSHHQNLDGCKNCHAAADGNLVDWVHTAFGPTSVAGQSSLCVRCHSQIGRHAMLAHSVSSELLAERTRNVSRNESALDQPLLLKFARTGRPEKTQKLACATCHEEHRGVEFDMAQMGDLNCQVCHSKPFHSFEKGHPDFTGYPYKRRTRLYFDHLSHYGRYFHEITRFQPGEAVKHTCSDCHKTDVAGRSMLIKDYEQACASCHDHQIRDNTIAGIAFFGLPAVDVETLNKARKSIGEWPQIYPQHVAASGVTSPFTRLLLNVDEDFATAERNLNGMDLSDLTEATPTQLNLAADYVWAFKRAFNQLILDGREKLQEYLATALETDNLTSDTVSSSIFHRLVEAQQRWLPNLNAEIVNGKDPVEQDELQEVIADGELQNERTRIERTDFGWYLRDSDLSLRYRPIGHADTGLRAWLDGSIRVRAKESEDERAAVASTALQGIFANLSKPSAPGRCMKCHTADERQDGNLGIHWSGKKFATKIRTFTEFVHRPHIAGLDDQSCAMCHVDNPPTLNEDTSNRFRPAFIHSDWSINIDASRFQSDFADIKKSTCAKCHQPSGADHRCLTCHNYHVNSPASQAAKTE